MSSETQNEMGHWEQFEQFRKKINQECQSEEKHFKMKRESYSSLEKVRRSSFAEDPQELNNSTIQQQQSTIPKPILSHPTETDRLIKLRIENQELREQIVELKAINQDDIKQEYQKQLEQQKQHYEADNKELTNKVNQFNDELEELKKVYKDKNMKLYNLVLQLEKEKQELIEKNIQILEQQSQKQSINIHSLVDERTRVLADQIEQLEERNAKLQVEKSRIEDKYMNLLQNQSLGNSRVNNNSTNIIQQQKLSARSSDRKPPIPLQDNKNTSQSFTQSFEQLPPAQKSILKNSKLQLSAPKHKENLTPSNRSRILETPKSSRKQPVSQYLQSGQKKQKSKKIIYSKGNEKGKA